MEEKLELLFIEMELKLDWMFIEFEAKIMKLYEKIL
jgi:hypothetical protein|tara:strand:- start:151 stop:258 length:108 start_codon:yes stop_codon:yes gene_type:complete